MPELGDFGVVRTNGFLGRLIRVVTRSSVNHAFVYVGGGQIVEAEPAGARLAPVSEYPTIVWAGWPLTGPQQTAVADAARSLLGTPYSWVDCAAIGVAKLFGEHVPPAVRRRLNRKDRLMCSQLVDYSYQLGGVTLFPDGRYDGDVSPGDLLDLIRGAR